MPERQFHPGPILLAGGGCWLQIVAGQNGKPMYSELHNGGKL